MSFLLLPVLVVCAAVPLIASASSDLPWRAANKTVGELKGHAGHMKTPASADGDSPAPVTPSGHQHGHH